MSILITLILFAIPQLEKSRRMEINELFGLIVQHIIPLAETGLPGMLVFAFMVAFCEGVSVLPMRYIEFLVGLCYNLKEYVFVVVIGKTMGAIFTY